MSKAIVLPLTLAAFAFAPLTATAKLPPPTPEAKQKSDEAAARSAWSDKVAAFKLCLAMERTAETYRRQVKSTGKEALVPVDTPSCADPGPFTAPTITPMAQKPLEASEAHSPPGTAHSPPSTKATHSEINSKK